MQINVHKIDNSRIEIRAVHEIAPPARKRDFTLNAYFFVPSKLASGGGDEFDGSQALGQGIMFPKVQRKNYYEIFAMGLAAILDDQNELSPLYRLGKMAQELVLPTDKVLYELQMLACVSKNACGNARRAQIKRLQTRKESLNEVEGEFRHISESYLSIQSRLEQLGERYLHEVLQNVSVAYLWALEDLSHQILDWLMQALRLSEHYSFSQEFSQFIQAELELQWLYQKQHGFITLNEDEYNNESYLFHQRELKAWRNGGLSMFSTESRSQNVMAHICLSAASALAMAFALGITVLTMYYYGQWSMPFLFFAVLGYVFKDRIKEILRNLFSDKLGNYNLRYLYDPRSKRRCGSIRETLGICETLPVEISTLRNLHKNALSVLYNRETTIVYREQLKLNSLKLFKTHKRLQSGRQILEFNFLPYLQNIKESEAKQLWHPIQSPDGSEKSEFLRRHQKLKIKRSYHLNLVVQASSGSSKLLERYRIVLRNNKIAWIKRIAW